jgi:plastocyanin
MRSIARGVSTVAIAATLAACSGTGAPATGSAATTLAATGPAVTAAAVATAAATAKPAPPCADATGATTVEATVTNYQWSQPITAKVGDVITWTNTDPETHRVRLSDGSCAMTNDIAKNGGKQSLVFTTPGSFKFYCVQHVTMKGVITIS